MNLFQFQGTVELKSGLEIKGWRTNMDMKTREEISTLVTSVKETPRYALSDDIVKTSTILSTWNAATHLIPCSESEDTIVPSAEFAIKENYVKQPKACRNAVKWLTLITKWALQEGLSSFLTKQIVEEHLEEFKHYICVNSTTWEDFVQVFFARHKIDGAKQFVQWYRQQKKVAQNTWFSYDELEKATNKFSRTLKCTEGKTGVVYKGIDQFSEQFIAVKKFKKVTDSSLRRAHYEAAVHQYIKRTLKTDRGDHVPLVALLGFCPWPSDPLLVFEFVPNGNLRQHLQGHYGNYLHSHASARLRIAMDVADALKRLHYDCEFPVLHRDLKSTNILLDNLHRAKLADLSTAKVDLDIWNSVLPEMESILADCSDDWRTIGTTGYVDPVYEQTGRLNDLTDVYSFGVVLLELVTHLKAWDPRRHHKLLTDLVKEKMRVGNVNKIVRLGASGSVKPSTPAEEGRTTLNLMLRLGLECCSVDLTTRPRIDEVERTLRQLQERSDDAMDWFKIDAALAAVGENDAYTKNLTLATMVARK